MLAGCKSRPARQFVLQAAIDVLESLPASPPLINVPPNGARKLPPDLATSSARIGRKQTSPANIIKMIDCA